MTDLTPHEGGRHTPEDLLDALLAGNHAELLDTMTQALDTDAGLRALATLRTGPPAKIEDRPSEAPPCTHRLPAAHPEYGYGDYAPLSIEEEGPHPAVEMINVFIEDLTELRRTPTMPWEGTAACSDCALVLGRLSSGLQKRFMARSEAHELLTEAWRHLRDLQTIFPPSLDPSPTHENTREIIVLLAEELKRITVVVTRMFDDAYDNISIEY